MSGAGVGCCVVVGNGESPPAGVRAGSRSAPRWALRWGCALVHAGGHDDDVGVAVVAGGGVVVGFCWAGVGVGDVFGGFGEAVELVGCDSVWGGAGFFWCGEELGYVGPGVGLLVCAAAGDACAVDTQ